MNLSADNAIPSMELEHEGQKVNFALRTMEEIHATRGNLPDIPHRHDFYTILWSKNACGQHFIDYKEHFIEPNVIFFVNPGQVHQVITFGEPEGVVIMFTREFLSRNLISEDFLVNLGLFSESADTPPLRIEETNVKKLHELSDAISETFHSNTEYQTEIIGAYLKLFLIECNKFAPKPDIEISHMIQSGRTILKNFKEQVEKNFNNWHKVANYADALNISPDYLNNVIKNSIGKTAKEFIQDRLILEAKRLGVHTYMSNKEIAYEIGFDDPSHFSKFYKNNEGIPYSDFRNSLK